MSVSLSEAANNTPCGIHELGQNPYLNRMLCSSDLVDEHSPIMTSIREIFFSLLDFKIMTLFPLWRWHQKEGPLALGKASHLLLMISL